MRGLCLKVAYLVTAIRRWCHQTEPIAGGILAIALLGMVNILLFHEGIIQRYAAVFAVGRAMDKQQFTEHHCPSILILGNSRVDNGIDPVRMHQYWRDDALSVFNLGIPGANARIGHGQLARLNHANCLSAGKIQLAILGLDESYLQDDDSLGYTPFFADRSALIEEGALKDWFGTWLRLWAYTDNLRQLHEPEKAIRFMQATFELIEPVGGAAQKHLGYRAGFGEGNQNAAQVMAQDAGTQLPPRARMLEYLFKMQALLHRNGAQLIVVFPPLLNRNSAYLDPTRSEGYYTQIPEQLRSRGALVVTSQDPVPRTPEYFINAGHLNDRGAEIYSQWLASMTKQLAVLK